MVTLNRIVRNRFFINACQWVMLGIFITLLVTLFIPGKGLNIASLMVWGLWWPGLVITTLTLGRIWCAVCPLKLVSVIASRHSIFSHDKAMNDEKMWSLLLSFLFVHLLMLQFPLVYNSRVTGVFLCALLVTSAYSVLSRQLFCNSLCPLEFMLSCYRLCSPISFGILDSPSCEKCDICTVHCTDKKDKTWFYSNKKVAEDIDCTLCFNCVRKCQRQNIGYKWLGFFKRIKKEHIFPLPKGIFLVFMFCLMLSEWLGEIPGFDFLLANNMLIKKMGFTVCAVYISGKVPVFFLLIPFFLWFFPVSSYAILTGSIKSFFTKYSIFFVPLAASIHLAKSAIKINVLLPFILRPQCIRLYIPYAGIDICKILNEDVLLLCIALFVVCIGIFSVIRMDKEYSVCNLKAEADRGKTSIRVDYTWLVGLFLLFLTFIISIVILVVFAKKGAIASFDIC